MADELGNDDAKAEKLKEYFRASNTVEYTVEEKQVTETETAKKLTNIIRGKTKEELMKKVKSLRSWQTGNRAGTIRSDGILRKYPNCGQSI